MITKHSDKAEPWELSLRRLLPLWGHRNWIVIADSAYPAQSNPGIETVATGADHLLVLKTTLDAIDNSKHVRANVYMDAEFRLVRELDGHGVERFRQNLARLIGNREKQILEHEQIIAKLDESAKLFRALILKSTLTIPYTSVFFELDCGYWTREAEHRLRQSLTKRAPSAHQQCPNESLNTERVPR